MLIPVTLKFSACQEYIRAHLNVLNPESAVTYHRIALTDAERTEKVQKNVYPVVKVVSVVLKVFAECVRSA